MNTHSNVKPLAERVKGRQKYEVADILHLYWRDYLTKYNPPEQHGKVVTALLRCRTSFFGGHLDRCDNCGAESSSYNSCCNRHCPKCQTITKEKWLQDRKAELLPMKYFHNVFTLPHELNPIALYNGKVIYKLLFQAVSETLLEFGLNPKHIGGKLGFISILHTWDQLLKQHIHLHVIIPAGGLSFDSTKWINPKKGNPKKQFLFHVEALSEKFRGKFLFLLEQSYNKGELRFKGSGKALGTKQGFAKLLKDVWKKKWVVYLKRPFAGPEKLLDYLGRYTHRVAISNHRILSIDNNKVTLYPI